MPPQSSRPVSVVSREWCLLSWGSPGSSHEVLVAGLNTSTELPAPQPPASRMAAAE